MKRGIFLIFLFIVISGGASNGQNKSKTIMISGFVVDADKQPVQGAVIMADSNGTGITTKKNGSYKIKISDKVKTLGILAPDKKIYEEVIDGRTRIDFALSDLYPDQNSITAKDTAGGGYSTKTGKSPGRAENREEARKRRLASYNTIYDMIRGEVPGVQVMGESITIEGVSSLHMSSEPLFVVNGVPVNSLDFVSPQMVKSIEVLKGSETSFYGLRGVNGVIIITLQDAVE